MNGGKRQGENDKSAKLLTAGWEDFKWAQADDFTSSYKRIDT